MNISALGLAFDFAAGCQGMDMGPAALRHTQLLHHLRALGHQVTDHGDLWPTLEDRQAPHQAGQAALPKVERYLKTALEQVQALPEGFTLTLGGDHAVSLATVAGNALRGSKDGAGKRIGLIWVDAHADFNTPQSSPSGNVHGMPVAHLVGLGHPSLLEPLEGWRLRASDIVMIGLRSVDEGERKLLHEHNVRCYSMQAVDELGMARVLEESLDYLADTQTLHVSLDADAFDPSVCPGLGTPVEGGLTYREGRLLMEKLHESQRVSSLDLVEVNPLRCLGNQTARVMADMGLALLGQTLL